MTTQVHSLKVWRAFAEPSCILLSFALIPRRFERTYVARAPPTGVGRTMVDGVGTHSASRQPRTRHAGGTTKRTRRLCWVDCEFCSSWCQCSRFALRSPRCSADRCRLGACRWGACRWGACAFGSRIEAAAGSLHPRWPQRESVAHFSQTSRPFHLVPAFRGRCLDSRTAAVG